MTISNIIWKPVFRNLREYMVILLSLFAFARLPELLRGLDATAAPIDAGILSALVLAVISILLFKAVTWFIIKSIWPVLAEYSEHHFERNFKSLLSWQKVIIYLGFYLLLLLFLVLALAAIL